MPLKTSKELTNDTVKLISRFKSGELKPIPTGIWHLDENLLGGLLPGTVLGIVGRSQHGKSYDMERIQRHILNNQDDVVFLNCNWEMSHFKLLVRDISQRSGKNVKQVLFDPLDKDSTKELKDICDTHRTENVFYQNEPVSDSVFSEDVESLIEKFPDKKIVVAIDNLENILRTKGSQKDNMDALLYQINVLKNKHNFISFIVLNQMNQNYLLRMDNIKNQKPNESDIYGSDQLLKLCDVVYIKVIPWKLGIREKFMVFGEHQYEWIEEHTIENGKGKSFDPYGRAYFFYVKIRQPEDEKYIKDVFVEVMFEKTEEEKNKEQQTSLPKTPTFTTPKSTQPENHYKDLEPNTDLNVAFGDSEEDGEVPF